MQHHAGQRVHRPVVAAGRPGRAAPTRYSGELWCTNGNGTNSGEPAGVVLDDRRMLRVNPVPPRGVDGWPLHIIVELDRSLRDGRH